MTPELAVEDNDTVPAYMYDQVQVAYQKQRERTRKLRQERDELRAALARFKQDKLKQQSPIDRMWERLAEHQRYADERGYGEAWAEMCQERTSEAASPSPAHRASCSHCCR
jgi:hypothetical protein